MPAHLITAGRVPAMLWIAAIVLALAGTALVGTALTPPTPPPPAPQPVPGPAPAPPDLAGAFSAEERAALAAELRATRQLLEQAHDATSGAGSGPVAKARDRLAVLADTEQRAAAAAPPAQVLGALAARIDDALTVLRAAADRRPTAPPAPTLSPLLLAGAVLTLLAAVLAILARPLTQWAMRTEEDGWVLPEAAARIESAANRLDQRIEQATACLETLTNAGTYAAQATQALPDALAGVHAAAAALDRSAAAIATATDGIAEVGSALPGAVARVVAVAATLERDTAAQHPVPTLIARLEAAAQTLAQAAEASQHLPAVAARIDAAAIALERGGSTALPRIQAVA